MQYANTYRTLMATTFVAIFFCSFSSCKDENLCHWDDVPSSLLFEIVKSNTIVTDDDLRDCKLAYYTHGTKTYISDFFLPGNTEYQNKGLIGSREIGIRSSVDNIKTYYLEYPNQWKTDTLYVDYLKRGPDTDCRYVLNEVHVNGKLAPTDNSFDLDSPVYILNKP